MSANDWKLLAAFGVTAWLVSRWSGEAATLLVLALGATALFTHGEAIKRFAGVK